MDNAEWTTEFLRNITPRSSALKLKPALQPDEAYWFRRAIEGGLISVGECRSDCPRCRRHNETTWDEFLTPAGQHRHLFSISEKYPTRMNREYIPHIAAVARAIMHFEFPADRYSFSLYRTFQRGCVTKKVGDSYETDAEFYAPDGTIDLQIEAKKDEYEVIEIVKTINECGTFKDLPFHCKKELEYVLDIAPRQLWLVAPGCIEPERYVYALHVEESQVQFRKLDALVPRAQEGSVVSLVPKEELGT